MIDIQFGKGLYNFLNLLQATLLTCRRAVVFNVYRSNFAFAKFMDRSSHLIDMKRGITVLTANLRKKEILKKSLYCVFWILIILGKNLIIKFFQILSSINFVKEKLVRILKFLKIKREKDGVWGRKNKAGRIGL